LKVIYYNVKRIIITCLNFINQDFYHLLNSASIGCSFALIFEWLTIISCEFTLTMVDDNSPSIDTYGDLTYLATLYNLYIFWAALNTLLIYLRAVQFFDFSEKLSLLVLVISRAKVNLFFFTLMFMIVIKLFFILI